MPVFGGPNLENQRNILIIHGTKAVVDALLSLFKGQPVLAVGATTPDEARRLFDLLEPHLVISSLRLNWLPLLRRFRSERPELQFIGLTDSDELAQKARDIGIENIVLTGADPESSAEGIELCVGTWLAVQRPADGITILIVDDDVKILDILFNHLSSWGYTVRTAQSGKLALEIVERDLSISIVTLDVVMPEMGGLETLKQLKAGGNYVDVILISDFADRQIVNQAFSLGAFDFLLKPIDIDLLENSIMACLAKAAFRKRPWWKRFAQIDALA
jgi:DNA-binding NtrC family response regulator